MNEEDTVKARERQRVILEVWSGRMTVADAARTLGISRKTYYEWQDRGLSAMQKALTDRPGGRPLKPVDPETERLRAEVEALQQDRRVLEGRLHIQAAIRETLETMGSGGVCKKKTAGLNRS